jgi:hypothetical protein
MGACSSKTHSAIGRLIAVLEHLPRLSEEPALNSA